MRMFSAYEESWLVEHLREEASQQGNCPLHKLHRFEEIDTSLELFDFLPENRAVLSSCNGQHGEFDVTIVR